jgi:hypothetical protein
MKIPIKSKMETPRECPWYLHDPRLALCNPKDYEDFVPEISSKFLRVTCEKILFDNFLTLAGVIPANVF